MVWIEPQSDHHLRQSFEDFSAYAERYGAKAAGLRSIPPPWCPPYVAIGVELNVLRRDGKSAPLELSVSLDQWIDARRPICSDGLIVRSSGIDELIADRGRYLSIRVPQSSTASDVLNAADEIFAHARDRGEAKDIGLIVQAYIAAEGSGHLSNEVGVSPTRNQWQYELDRPVWAAPRGLNSKFATGPDPIRALATPLTVPHPTLRSVGKWLTETCAPRVHVEWVVAHKRLWLVQLDFEWSQLDSGIDPLDHMRSTLRRAPEIEAARVFEPYIVGNPTRWKKLRNLQDFDFDTASAAPRLYSATADRIDLELATDAHGLAREIEAITAGSAVIRMEIAEEGAANFNLPRTETVDGKQAVDWLAHQIGHYRDKVSSLGNVAFITHAFLPAHAGVWAYADPGQKIAFVDGLWGLPDGLQVLPHDTYQVDVKRQKIVSEKIRYKPRFLYETPSGEWKYVDVLKRKSRASTLPRSDVVEIGIRTARIAEKLGERAQIMWFSGIPSDYQVGRNLPWFRARETVDPAPRQGPKFRPITVSTAEDLTRLPSGNVTIRLDPDADLIRSEQFLDQVIAVAQARSLPVEILGSALSHTYYRLFQSGVVVNPPNYANYSRSRGKRIFGKLVRDKIPENIKGGGENVVEGRLAKSDLIDALFGKLFEEAFELRTATQLPGAVEEISDLFEILRAIAQAKGANWQDVEEAANRKRADRGGFVERRVLVETSFAQPGQKQAGLSEIRLHELDAPRSTGEGSVIFPFSALLEGKLPIETTLRNNRIALSARMSRNGLVVSLKIIDEDNSREEQLRLFE